MNYDIVDEYGYENDYKYLKDVIAETFKQVKVDNADFCIIFVDSDRIQEINKNYRNIDKVTDVISFALEDNEDFLPEGIRILGDIYICIPKMIEQAKTYGHSEKRELAFLCVHGLLHLLGYDHMTEDDETVMFGLQELILNNVGIKN